MGDLEARAFRREGNHLVPADAAAEERIQSVKEGQEVLITWRKPRSIQNHKHFFAILRVAAEQLPSYTDEEELLDALKIAVSWTRPVQRTNGEIIWLPKTINFAALDEDTFRRFKDRCLYVLGQLLGVDPQELLEEVGGQNRRNHSYNDPPPTGADDRPEPPASIYEEPE